MALEYPRINPDIVSIGPIHIRWYGLVYVLGLLLGRWMLVRSAKAGRLPLPKPQHKDDPNPVDTIVIYLALGIMLGGRLGYVLFYNFKLYLQNPLDIFKVWEGGMAFHGAFTGIVIAIFLISRKLKIPFWQLADNLAFVTPVCLGAGRIANFINGELAGRVTDVPWGMIFPDYGPLPRHPSQLYEALLEGLLLQSILFLMKSQFAKPGRIAGAFVTGYAIVRLIVENYREPDAQLGFVFASVTMGQILSFAMLGFGIWIFVNSRKNKPLKT